MKKIFCLFILFFSAKNADSQNLVPNGGFEDSIVCVNNANTMHPALWFPPTQGSPDYFPQPNTTGCILNQTFWGGGQNGLFGNQIAHSGHFYSGFYTSTTGDVREYLEIKLSDSLFSGKRYAVEFYASISEYSHYAYDGIGISLSHDSLVDYSSSALSPIPNLPFTAGNPSGNIITDSINWVAVRDTFVAIGGEHYLILGNIRSNAQTQYIQFNNTYQAGAYYFVDDVSLVDLGYTGIEEQHNPINISLTPNPSNGEFILKGNFPIGTRLEIFDLLGQKLSESEIPKGNESPMISLLLANGVYFYRVLSNGQELKSGKLVISRQ